MISSLLRILYGSLWKAAIPVLQRHKRLKVGFAQRLVPDSWPEGTCLSEQTPLFWIQAASGGEATLLSPLIQALCNEFSHKHPGALPRFLCTTCTEQGMDIIHKAFDGLPENISKQCTAAYFPLDAPAIMRKALQQAHPRLLILLETELWPGLLHELKCAHIPYAIANARMTAKTCQTYKKARFFFTTHQPGLITATTVENASRFSEVFMPSTFSGHKRVEQKPCNTSYHALNTLSANPTPLGETSAASTNLLTITTAPNIKFDVIHQQLTTPKTQLTPDFTALHRHLADYLSSPQKAEEPSTLKKEGDGLPADLKSLPTPILPPIVALASIREEEETEIGTMLTTICQHSIQNIPLLCLLAPRHLHRIPFWQSYLEEMGIPFLLKSQLPELFKQSEPDDQVRPANAQIPTARPLKPHCILWDTFGELDQLYALADVAFVGGSLAPLGGQNFLEPLASGTTTVIGPFWSNFAWVGHELFGHDILFEEVSSTEVTQKVLNLMDTFLAPPLLQWANIRAIRKKHVRSQLQQIIRANTGGSALTAQHIFSSFSLC